MRLIAVGRLRAGPERELFETYTSRLKPALNVTELREGEGPPADMKRREGDAILAALTDKTQAIVLDLGAPAPTSEQLARHLEAWLSAGRPLAFVIGGAEGLSSAVLARANHQLSLGPLTWPHMLVRIMLVEQLYRARCIALNHPYHRSGRPS
jgi:23S rRNA (pseudouridine1915-N3)-methyltransferase